MKTHKQLGHDHEHRIDEKRKKEREKKKKEHKSTKNLNKVSLKTCVHSRMIEYRLKKIRCCY